MTSFRPGDTVVMVGGGDGGYVARVETPRTVLNVLNAADDDGVDITVGGQACVHPGSQVIELAQVVAALQDQLSVMEDQHAEYEVIVKQPGELRGRYFG
jgi:hypothetical protein